MSKFGRADGNIDFPKFIALVKNLWEEVHPDIPLRPVQSARHAKYPVMIYSLENRTTFNNEPKQRFRETIYTEDPEGKNVQITSQRFKNTISFSALTENNPNLGELLIETFEDFMLEYTPIFKKLGVSDIFYARRLSDREENRPDENVEVRTVAYLVILEKLRVTEVEKLQQILIKARLRLQTHTYGAEFWALPDLEGLYVPQANSFSEGELVTISDPSPSQDPFANGETEVATDYILPVGINRDYLYQIASINGDRVYLQKMNGDPSPAFETGMGIMTPAGDVPHIDTEIIDDFGTEEED